MPLSVVKETGALTAQQRLVELQDDIRTMCAQKSAEDDFPALWKAAGEDARKRHYFTAMERVCEIPDMEKQRRCGSLTSSRFILTDI